MYVTRIQNGKNLGPETRCIYPIKYARERHVPYIRIHTREDARDTTIILEILIGKKNVIINRDGRFQRTYIYKRDLFVPEYVLQNPRGVTMYNILCTR